MQSPALGTSSKQDIDVNIKQGALSNSGLNDATAKVEGENHTSQNADADASDGNVLGGGGVTTGNSTGNSGGEATNTAGSTNTGTATASASSGSSSATNSATVDLTQDNSGGAELGLDELRTTPPKKHRKSPKKA